MDIREGDPILSKDGKRVVGYFDKAFSLAGDYLRRAVLASFEEATAWAENGAHPRDVPEYRIHCRIVMPDRTYWILEHSDSVREEVILRDNMIKRAPPPPSSDPAGMVTAIDQLLADMPDSSFSPEGHRLRYMREMYEYKAKRSAPRG